MKRSRGKPARPPLPARARPTAAGAAVAAPAPWAPAVPLGVALAVLAALALLAVALAWHPVGDYFTESDFFEHALGGRLIATGRLDVARYGIAGPFYDLLLAIPAWLHLPPFAFGCVLSVASAAVVLGGWLGIVRARLGGGAALATVALVAANGVFFRYGYSATSDLPALALQALSLHALLAGRGRRAPERAGAFAALAFLTRYNALVLLPAAITHLLWVGPGSAAERRRALLRWLAAFALIVLPWTAWSRLQGHWPAEGLVHNASFYAAPTADRNVQDRPVDTPAPGTAAPAGGVLVRLVRQAPAHLRDDARMLLGWPIAALLPFGVLALLLARARARAWGPIALQGAWLFLGLAPIFYSDRYALAYLPVYASLAGAGLSAPWLAPRVGRLVLPLAVLLVAWPLAVTLRANVTTQRFVRSQIPLEVPTVARALRVERPGNGGVLARKGAVAFYAGRPDVFFPRVRTLAALAEAARAGHASHLYFSWYEGLLRHEFWYLLDTTATVPGLVRVLATTTHPAVLYRIGPEFGRDPAWLADSAQRELHLSRAVVQVLNDQQAWDAHLVLGHHSRREGRWAEALEHYLAVTRGAPSLARGWVFAGDMQLELGRIAAARASYERAGDLEPRSLGAQLGKGWVAYRSGAWGVAASDWAPVVGMTTDARTLRAMADAFARTGDVRGQAAVALALARRPADAAPR